MDREQPSFPITGGQDKKKKSLKDIKNGTGKTILGSQPDQIDLEPRTTNDKSFAEAKESTAVFTFGRFNPPTVGHEKLINKVANVAKEHNGSAHIFASHTENKSKDPLPQSKKVGYLQKVAGSSADVHGSSKESPSFLHAAKKLHDAGHKHLVMVAGSDRVDEYQKTLNKYNGHPDHFNFKSIKVVSAGQRDPDAEGVEGMSGTKMRALARSGKHSEFKAGLPKSLHPHAKEIGDHIRSVPEAKEMEGDDPCWDGYQMVGHKMKKGKKVPNCVPEEVELEERVLNIQQRIKRALQMRKIEPKLQRFRELAKRKMAGEPQLKRRAQKMARQVVRRRVAGQRGIDYQKLAPSDKMQIDRQVDKKVALIQALAKRMYPRVRKAEVERLQRARMSMSGMTAPIKPAATPLTMSFDFIDLYMKSAERLTEKDVLSLISKSETSGIDFKTILEVFNEGYDSDISSKPHLSRSQLGFNDVNSYIANHISEVKVDIPAGVESKLKQLVKKMADGKLDEESLGKVTRGGPKKFQVKVKNPKTGNVVTVNFGDPNLSIKRDDPERRKAFRARHNCDTATDRTTPRYWSCRQWRAGAKVEA